MASVHLLGFALGHGAIWARARALRGLPGPTYLRRTMLADAWWRGAGLLVVGTGLARAIGGAERPAEFYWASRLFWVKMACVAAILILEIGPARGLARWRREGASAATAETEVARRWSTVSRVEAGLMLVVMFLATALAR
ncbi:MAG: DUF2214 family protein [Gemmatimonadetes bacterium]|nr:DUF2214 family protein [Gemmatimonadota bacterium]